MNFRWPGAHSNETPPRCDARFQYPPSPFSRNFKNSDTFLFDGGEIELFHALVPQPNPEAIHDAFAACILMKPEVHSQRGNRAMSQLGG